MNRIGFIVGLFVLFMIPISLSGCWGSASNKQTGSSYAITSLLLDPNSCSLDGSTGLVDCPTVYAATAGGGIFKSPDGGGSWTRIVDGLIEWNISKLVMDPKDPATLYAGTENNGLFKTIDGGANWFNPSTSAGTIKSITAIAVDPWSTPCSPSRCLYVGSQESGVWVSQDDGLNWTQMNNGLVEMTVTALTVFSYIKLPSDIYAGTEGGHLYRFNRTSNKWEEALLGGLSEKTTASPLVIAVNPRVPTDLYVGTSGGEGQSLGSLFKGSNGGTSWNVVSIPFAVQSFSVRVLTFCIQKEPRCPPTIPDLNDTPADDALRAKDALYAGVYGLSRNYFSEGNFWENIDNGEIQQGNNTTSLAIDTLRHTTLYTGTFLGYIMKSQDAGATWKRININL
ncbi:MAG: hypothetical protein HY204_01385 [Nitrospirae bacterium]|nr:hypothetical protein [Nitrospirota bacterium]